MDQPLTWKSLADALAPMGRGAPYRLSKALGLNASDFYRRLKRDTELTERQAKIARDFLAGGTGEGGDDASQPAQAPVAGRRLLPVYGYAAASEGDRIALNEGEILEYRELPMGLELGPGEYFIALPIGSSMEPRIFPGEPQVCRRNWPPARGKDVVIEMKDGSGLIKTYKGARDGQLFVEQWNEPKTLAIPQSDVKALHAVAFKL